VGAGQRMHLEPTPGAKWMCSPIGGKCCAGSELEVRLTYLAASRPASERVRQLIHRQFTDARLRPAGGAECSQGSVKVNCEGHAIAHAGHAGRGLKSDEI